MFDKQAVEDYRSVTAPDKLKHRVINAATAQKRVPVRLVSIASSLAACLALIVATAVLWSSSPASVVVSTDGLLVSSASMPAPASTAARMQAEQCAVITLQAEGDITVSSDAVFYVQENGTLTSISSPYTASNTLTLYWYVTSSDATMTVNRVHYTLHADAENGTITIVQD